MGGFDYFITDANVMESLYSIGNTSGSMFYGACPHSMNCLSHTRCVAFGWQLGKPLSKKQPISVERRPDNPASVFLYNQ